MTTTISTSEELAHKSVAACLAAIEVYNKPDFKYREETFSILMTNAWELLLKAKYIKENNDDILSVVEHKQVVDGDGNKVSVPKLNRSNSFTTHGITHLVEKLFQDKSLGITKACCDNIYLLLEVRDNSVHFLAKDLHLSKRIQEVGTASLRNYLSFITAWFSFDLSRYNFFLMPLAFYHGFEAAEALSVSSNNEQVANFLQYLKNVEESHSGSESESQHVSLCIETKVVRSRDEPNLGFRWTDDPNAPAVNIREEDILKNYPHEYKELTNKLKKRYTDFVENNQYHNLRRPLEAESKYCKLRLLNPLNPNGVKKRLYSPEIIKEFDKHYTRKS